jgi:hypothetical protein
MPMNKEIIEHKSERPPERAGSFEMADVGQEQAGARAEAGRYKEREEKHVSKSGVSGTTLHRLWWKRFNLGISYPLGVILSVVLVIAGIFLLPGFIYRVVGNTVLFVIWILILVPLLPTVTAILQRKVEPSLVNAFTLYIFEAVNLYLDLFLLLLILPYIALHLVWVINGIFLLALIVGAAVTLFRHPEQLDAEFLYITGKSLALAAATTIALFFIKGREDRLIDYYRKQRERLFNRVKGDE